MTAHNYLTLLSSSTSPVVAAPPVEKRAPDGPDLVSLSNWCWLGWADSFSVNFSMAGISIRLALNPISWPFRLQLAAVGAVPMATGGEALNKLSAAASFFAAAGVVVTAAADLPLPPLVDDLLEDVRLFTDFFVIILLMLPQSVGRLASE